MTSHAVLYYYLEIFILIVFTLNLKTLRAQLVPALFVFGDSLVDVGNNNYLTLTSAKSDLPYHGIDFPTHQPNGRFSNGKISADLLAEKLGLQFPPPYLSLVNTNTNNFANGVSFASAAAGILNSTNRCLDLPLVGGPDVELIKFMIPMDEQIEYYAKVHEVFVQKFGQSGAAEHLSESVFFIVIGSTDVGVYFNSRCSSLAKKINPRLLIDMMLITMKTQLKRIYDLEGRKFAILGLGPIGCIPFARVKTKNEGCDEVLNYWASKYNEGLLVILRELKSEYRDFQYSYINSYDLFLDIMEHPYSYGFKELKSACCGLGRLNADIPCYPISSLCPDRSDHVFWDLYHPTEAVTRIIVEAAFDGPQQYVFPINIRKLVST